MDTTKDDLLKIAADIHDSLSFLETEIVNRIPDESQEPEKPQQWRVSDVVGCHIQCEPTDVIIDEDGRTVGYVVRKHSKLVATAPDLLDVSKTLRSSMKGFYDESLYLPHVFRDSATKMDEAIANADQKANVI